MVILLWAISKSVIRTSIAWIYNLSTMTFEKKTSQIVGEFTAFDDIVTISVRTHFVIGEILGPGLVSQ